jgi:aryl-alcohol dehydrogenase-like predicted oxidoreductase
MRSSRPGNSTKILRRLINRHTRGNFIDTANNYQNDDSEKWLGEWMKERGNRDQIVLASKLLVSYDD